MELHEYPRPTNDTGIGIHWSPGVANAIGMATLREQWLPELHSLGVKWVKIYNHDGALDFAQVLLNEGIMPVVRIYRSTPNPGRLGLKDLVTIDAYVRAGIRYFEFNSEPDLDSEWRGGRVPANGLELLAEDTIANMEAIVERGGMPGIPALSNGCRWDLVGKIVAMGRKDLFAGPVWQAVHNYSGNRPLDYPYDIGNQEGAAFTERFYQLVSEEPWEEHAWRGRSLQEVNRLRLDRCSPGMSTNDDHACFVAYEYLDALNRKHLGHSLPILSTESGYIVGEDSDPRYPATTPNLHMAQTLELCRVMMGTSQRYSNAPDYYFCTAFWLLGNATLGSSSSWWEKHAWYSSRWQDGALPIVKALKAEPKAIRHWSTRGEVGERMVLRGFVLNATSNRTVLLEHDKKEVARNTLDVAGRFQFEDLLPGRYVVRLLGEDLVQAIELAPGQREVILNLAVEAKEAQISRSIVQGKVRGGASAVVVLTRSDGEEWVSMAGDDGTFRFIDLPAGNYRARVDPEGSRLDDIHLDGKNQRNVELAISGWGYTIESASEESGIAAFRVAVEGWQHAVVRAHSGTWSSSPTITGSNPQLRVDECEFVGVEPGHYIVELESLGEGIDPKTSGQRLNIEARVHVDKRRIPLVRFVYIDEPSAPPLPPVELPESDNLTTASSKSASIDHQIVSENNSSDKITTGTSETIGINNTSAETNTISSESVIAGHAPLAAGRKANLLDELGNERTAIVGTDDSVRFEQLPAGIYTLQIAGGYEERKISLNGSNGVEILFTPLLQRWEVQVSNAGSMPGFSAVRVEVQGHSDLPVRIWKDDWDGLMQLTGSRPDLGESALEFSPLGPGIYMVEPEGLDIFSDVELTGLEAIWVSFRAVAQPSEPNTVVPISVKSSLISSSSPAVIPTEARDSSISQPSYLSSLNLPTSTPPTSTLYLWVENQALSGEALVALLRFAANHQPAIGNDLTSALKADRVLILAEDSYFTQPEFLQFEQQLMSQGIIVEHLPIDELGHG